LKEADFVSQTSIEHKQRRIAEYRLFTWAVGTGFQSLKFEEVMGYDCWNFKPSKPGPIAPLQCAIFRKPNVRLLYAQFWVRWQRKARGRSCNYVFRR
jgi:hypothetical protein